MKKEEERKSGEVDGYSPEEEQTFTRLLERFHVGIEQLGIPAMNQEENKKDFVYRITQILRCPPGGEL